MVGWPEPQYLYLLPHSGDTYWPTYPAGCPTSMLGKHNARDFPQAMPGQGQGGPNEYVKRIGCIFLRSRSYNFVGSKIFLFCQSCNLLRPFSQNNVRKHQRSHFLSKSSRRIFCLKIKEKGEIKEPRDARLLLRRGIGPVPNQLEASCLFFTCVVVANSFRFHF